MDNKNHSILVTTNAQKVLDFFLDYPGKEFTEKEIQQATNISKSGTNYALKELVKADFISSSPKGKMHFYSLNYKNSVVKQLKVSKNIIYLSPLLKKLEKISSKIVLFGSSSRGEDVADSDIDLYIICNNKKGIEEQIKKEKFKRKIQPIIRNELEDTEFTSRDSVFYGQISKGVVLWEKI